MHSSATSGTFATDYYEYDQTHPCPSFPAATPIPLCAGVQWRNLTSKTTVLPNGQKGALATTTTYSFDHPEQGIPTSQKQWDYYTVSASATTFSPSGSPTRQVDQVLDYPVSFALFPSSIKKYGSGSLLSTTTLSYDTQGLQSAGTVPNHDNTLVTANRGNITAVTRSGAILRGSQTASTVQKNYFYDDAGSVVGLTDERNNKTTLAYESTDVLPLTITAPSTTSGNTQVSHIVGRTYDPASDVLLTTTDQNSQVTTYQYDQFGRNSAIRYSLGGSPTALSSTEYPSFNSTVTHTQQSSAVSLDSTEIVDAYGRVIQNTAEGISTETFYDGRGRVQSQSNLHTATPQQTDGSTTYVYDDYGRVHTATSPTGGVTTYDYQANTLTVTDPLSHQRLYTFDAFGDIVSVAEPDSSNNLTLLTAYSYNGNRKLVRIDQKGGSTDSSQWRTRTFNYDGVSRLISQTTPEAGTSTFDYDEAGNLVATHNANSSNNTTTFAYDENNRLKTKTLASGETHTYTYDGQDQSGDTFGLGRLTSTVSSTGTQMRFQHDPLARLIYTAYCLPSDCIFNLKAQASYDLQGNLTQLTYPDSRQLTGSYDKQNNLTQEAYTVSGQTPAGGSLLSNLKYSPNGKLRQATFGNGTQMGATYDPNTNLKSLAYQVDGTSVLSWQYTWDANGSNLRSIQDFANGRTQSYSYDQLDRISAMSDTGSTSNACLVNPFSFVSAAETYVIDPWGNLTQKQGNWSSSSTALPSNHLMSRTYDSAGNLIQDSASGAYTSIYHYRSDGLLLDSSTGTKHATYTYDALGQRVRKDGSLPKEYIYFSGRLLTIRTIYSDGSWGNAIDRLYGPNGVFGSFGTTDNSQYVPYYFLSDHLGSTAIGMDASSPSGGPASANFPRGEASYESYGQTFIYTLPDWFEYEDRERDFENDTDHTQFRQYSSQQGRWISPDPYNGSYDLTDPQSLNRYAYLSNRPMNNVDSTGLDGDDDWDWDVPTFVISWDALSRFEDYPYLSNMFDSQLSGLWAADNKFITVAAAVSTAEVAAPFLISSLPSLAAATVSTTSEGTSFVPQIGIAAATAASVSVQEEPALEEAVAKSPNQLGASAESAVRSVYDIGGKARFFVNNRYRIPDGFIDDQSLSEIKNVKTLSLTRQIRDYMDIADQNEVRFDLYVRPELLRSGFPGMSRPLASLSGSGYNGTINFVPIP